MKKLITILSLLVVAASLTAQSWATYYNTTPLDSVTGNNQLLFIVEDVDSTHVLYFSTLESIFEGQLNNEAGLYSALSDVTQFIEEGDNATLLNGTAYRLLYVDASGDVTELTLGADGTYLMSNGAAAVPTWETVGDLLSTNNLSDVSDPATALSNLGGLADEDTVQVNFSAGLDTVTSAGVLTVTWDSAAVYDYVDANSGTTIDSTDLEFKSEVYPLFTFNAGNKNEGDTAVFESGSILGSYFNRGYDTLVVTSIVASTGGDGNDTVSLQLAYNDTLANFSTEMVVMMDGSPMTIGTDASGYSPLTEYTTITNDTIPPDVWVWSHVASVTTGKKPTLFGMTVSGYKVKGTFDDDPFAGVGTVIDTIGLYTSDLIRPYVSLETNNLRTTRDTATSSGYIDTVYVMQGPEGVNDSLRIGIYGDNIDYPGDLLGQSDITLAAQGGERRWYPIPLQSRVNITSGTVYWLSLIGKTDASVNVFFLNNFGKAAYGPTTWSSGFPDPFTTALSTSEVTYYLYAEIKE